MRQTIAVSIFISILLLAACKEQDIPKTGRAIEKQEILEQFDEPIPEPIDISNDPKKQEVLEFVKGFLSSLSYPTVEGYPVITDKNSFKFIGFVVDGKTYTTTTQFRTKSLKGPMDKQYTIILQDLGAGVYEIKYVREDK